MYKDFFVWKIMSLTKLKSFQSEKHATNRLDSQKVK